MAGAALYTLPIEAVEGRRATLRSAARKVHRSSPPPAAAPAAQQAAEAAEEGVVVGGEQQLSFVQLIKKAVEGRVYIHAGAQTDEHVHEEKVKVTAAVCSPPPAKTPTPPPPPKQRMETRSQVKCTAPAPTPIKQEPLEAEEEVGTAGEACAGKSAGKVVHGGDGRVPSLWRRASIKLEPKEEVEDQEEDDPAPGKPTHGQAPPAKQPRGVESGGGGGGRCVSASEQDVTCEVQ